MTVKELIEILSKNKNTYDKQVVICNDSKTFHIKKVGIPQYGPNGTEHTVSSSDNRINDYSYNEYNIPTIEIGNNFDFQTDL